MTKMFITPLLAGLSVGIYCFVYCLPFTATVMVSEEGDKRKDLLNVLKFVSGRLVGYTLFGAAVGLLGERIQGPVVNTIVTVSLLLLSILLILHAAGLIGIRQSFCSNIRRYSAGFPFIMGILMGINICPPFLMSLAYVFTLHNILDGIIYFLVFFVGTSVYFLPLFFLGFLNRLREFRIVGGIAAIIVGALFFIYGIYSLLREGTVTHQV